MYYRFHRFLVLALLSFAVVACATAPAEVQDSERIATAKRFLRSWGAGEFAMVAFKRKLESDSKEQPGVAELTRRAFADVKAEDFEDLAAQIYAKRLTQQHLADLARFTESKTGNRFFRLVVASTLDGKSATAKNDVMRQFSADELIEIAKFSESASFAEMARALPAINRELGEAGSKFGEAKMRAYLKRQ